ncbi:peptidoglycan-binding protein [Telmatospirillum sp. J64-1]|uniref:peptidoglycan-binding domain-containing protein n=1 Tax=Telmatospirillum sp. J64-1 TaxID=2502183 RepID=UPI00115DFD6B|nr:peptidoglycan-binding domain-containing protein [Telmatospirillum sp. J64-1]
MKLAPTLAGLGLVCLGAACAPLTGGGQQAEAQPQFAQPEQAQQQGMAGTQQDLYGQGAGAAPGQQQAMAGQDIQFQDSGIQISQLDANLSPYEQRVVQEGSVGLDREVVAMVEERLQQRGHNVPVNGVLDDQTRNAVLNFQSNEGLRPTGQVDLSTLDALGIQVQAVGEMVAMGPASEDLQAQQQSAPMAAAPLAATAATAPFWDQEAQHFDTGYSGVGELGQGSPLLRDTHTHSDSGDASNGGTGGAAGAAGAAAAGGTGVAGTATSVGSASGDAVSGVSMSVDDSGNVTGEAADATGTSATGTDSATGTGSGTGTDSGTGTSSATDTDSDSDTSSAADDAGTSGSDTGCCG